MILIRCLGDGRSSESLFDKWGKSVFGTTLWRTFKSPGRGTGQAGSTVKHCQPRLFSTAAAIMELKLTLCISFLVYINLSIGERFASEPFNLNFRDRVSADSREDAKLLLRAWGRDPTKMVEQFQTMQNWVQTRTLQLKDCADRSQMSPEAPPDGVAETSRPGQGAHQIKNVLATFVRIDQCHRPASFCFFAAFTSACLRAYRHQRHGACVQVLVRGHSVRALSRAHRTSVRRCVRAYCMRAQRAR